MYKKPHFLILSLCLSLFSEALSREHLAIASPHFKPSFFWREPSASEPNFVDARVYLSRRNPAQLRDFLQDSADLLKELNASSPVIFKSVGAFDAYAATEFLCSVNVHSELLGECLLTIVASHHEVEPKSGTFKIKDSRIFSCSVSIRASIGQLMFALEKAKEEGRSTLEAPLPNEDFTFKSELQACVDK